MRCGTPHHVPLPQRGIEAEIDDSARRERRLWVDFFTDPDRLERLMARLSGRIATYRAAH
jgi:hypothetical protein